MKGNGRGVEPRSAHPATSNLQAELRRLRETELLPNRAIVEDMSELVVRWKPDGTRLFVNDAYSQLFGARRQELIGTSHQTSELACC